MYKIINKKNNFIILSIFLVVIILIGLCFIFRNNLIFFYKNNIKNQNNLNNNSLPSKVEEPKAGNIESVSKKIILPAGAQTYEIIQNKSVWPKILEAKIDPVDVHVGDKQTLSIIVSSKEKIKEVVAYIETDNGTTTLPLNFVGEVSDNDLLPKKYDLDHDNKLVILEDKDKYNFLKSIGFIFDKIKPLFGANVLNVGASNGDLSDLNLNAQNEENINYPKLKYENSWIVRDTHDKYYHTVFVIEDVLGNKNSITLAWSDACGIPNSGAWTISANCTISSTDGVENGNATINTYTLTLNAPFVWNPGYSINIGSGSIAVGSGGSLQKAYLFYVDEDGDGYYPQGAQLNYMSSPYSSGSVRRSLAYGIDCFDRNSYITNNNSCLVACYGNCAWSWGYTTATELVFNVGDTIYYYWNTLISGSYTYDSIYTADMPDYCPGGIGEYGQINPWVAYTSNGYASEVVQSCQSGKTYTITYRVKDGGGNIVTQSSIYIKIR